MDAVTRAEAIRDLRSVEITVGEGPKAMVFEAVIPNILTLLDAGLDPIASDLSVSQKERDDALAAQQRDMEKDIRKFYPMAVKICEAAMVAPRLYTGDGECPKDAVTPAILGNILFSIANCIFELLNKDAGEVGAATARFRVDTDREDGPEGGNAVRDESPGDSEDGKPGVSSPDGVRSGSGETADVAADKVAT